MHVEVRYPVRPSELVLGATYHVTGQAEGLDQIPSQVFRLESMTHMDISGSCVLVGTLWYRIWIQKWYSGMHRNHQLLGHNVGIGSGLTGKHDFHLESVRPDQVPSILGQGRAYGDYVDQTRTDEQKHKVLASTDRLARSCV